MAASKTAVHMYRGSTTHLINLGLDEQQLFSPDIYLWHTHTHNTHHYGEDILCRFASQTRVMSHRTVKRSGETQAGGRGERHQYQNTRPPDVFQAETNKRKQKLSNTNSQECKQKLSPKVAHRLPGWRDTCFQSTADVCAVLLYQYAITYTTDRSLHLGRPVKETNVVLRGKKDDEKKHN